MKRRFLLKLGFLVLAGAIINVAVAWGCVFASNVTTEKCRHRDEADLRWWATNAPPEFSRKPLDMCRGVDAGLETMMFMTSFYPGARRQRAGWPTLALEHSVWFPNTAKMFGDMKLQELRHTFDVGGFHNHIRGLPWLPIWPGFAVNTIFYAAIVWMLFAVPGAVRRRVRKRRGQCAACGYFLRGVPGSDKCPECGATA